MTPTVLVLQPQPQATKIFPKITHRLVKMEDISILKSVVIAANQYTYNKSEANLLQLQRYLEVLHGLTNRGNSLKFFDPKQLIPTEFLTSVAEILIDSDTRNNLASKIMTILQNLVLDPAIKEVLQNLDIPATLASFLRIHSDVNSGVLVLQCVKLLQELTYNMSISYPNSYLDDLVRFLVSKILDQDNESTIACLGLFANLCRNNPSVQNHIKSLENIKAIYKRFITFLSSRDLTVIVFSLSIIASLALLEDLGERLFNPKNIHQTFQLVFNIIVNGDSVVRCHAVDLFVDLLRYSKVQKALSSYKYFWICLKQILNLLTMSCVESVTKILELLLSFSNVPELLVLVSKGVLNLSLEEETISEPQNPFLSLIIWIQKSGEGYEEVSLLGLTVLHKALQDRMSVEKELDQQLAVLMPIIVKQLQLPMDKECHYMKNRCMKIAKSLELLLLLCQNHATIIYEKIDPESCYALVDFQLIYNPSGLSNACAALSLGWSETGVDVLLQALKLLSKIQETSSNVQDKFYQYLKDTKLIPFVAYALTSSSQNQVQTALDLLSLGCKLPEFPLHNLGETLSVKNAHTYLSDDHYSHQSFNENKFNHQHETSSRGREKSIDQRNTMQASVQAVIEKMESGLEVKDLKYSEIMDMYEHKIATLMSKESHLQDLVEAKTVALSQADRLISQYRGRIAQSEAEALKLRTLLQSSEKRSEDSKEMLNEIQDQKEKLFGEIDILSQEKQLLETELDEQRELYNEQIESLEMVQRSLATLKQEHQSLSEMHEMLRRHNENLKQQQEKTLFQLEQIEEEKKNLGRQFKEKETKVKELSRCLVKLESHNQKKDQELGELRLTVQNMHKDLSRQEETRKKLQHEVSSLNILCQQHEVTINEKSTVISTQMAELDKHAQIIAMVHSVSSGKVPLDKIMS